MPYPEELVSPMRAELTDVGFKELKSAEEVDTLMSEKGSLLVVINSVCGCAAGNARPAVKMAIQHDKKPDMLATVFAGQDTEATEQVRKFMMPYPPSSPAMALFKDGKLMKMIERHQIEGHQAESIANDLKAAFEQL
jgi:putative YphP/YqiW family bacilliredoxin